MGAFLLLWLGGWAVGWKYAATELLKGTRGPELFLLFWLGAWTIGGIFVVYYIYRIFRPSVPERLVLSYPTMIYDSGVPPFEISFSFGSQMDMWRKLFHKRARKEFDHSHLKTLRLRELDSGNRLTIDHGNKRYDLAVGATELEREWLHKVLSDRYKI